MSTEELRDELADIQRLTGLDDKAWYEKFGNTKGLYGLFTSYHQQELEQAVREARIDELKSLSSPRYLRNVSVTITDSIGGVYKDDSKLFISKYEVQERLTELQSTKEDKSNE